MAPTLRAACVFGARVVGGFAGDVVAPEVAEAARAELRKNLPWAQRWFHELLGERGHEVAAAALGDYITQRGPLRRHAVLGRLRRRAQISRMEEGRAAQRAPRPCRPAFDGCPSEHGQLGKRVGFLGTSAPAREVSAQGRGQA